MIVVREVFIAKPGMASALAKLFKEEMAKEPMSRNFRVMTDMIGTYNTVVMEMEFEDLTSFERDMKEYMSRAKEKPDPAKPRHVDMYTHGHREVLRVW